MCECAVTVTCQVLWTMQPLFFFTVGVTSTESSYGILGAGGGGRTIPHKRLMMMWGVKRLKE